MLLRTRRLLRQHLHFILIIAPLILIMTYPTVVHVFDASRFWVPSLDRDVWLKFWDAWHFQMVLAGKSDFYFTHFLFYPGGLSLVNLTYSLPHVIVLGALQTIMPADNAYCLTYLLNIFACALSGYIYCNYVFKDKWIALLGGIIFGCSLQVTARMGNPDISFIFTLPLTLYFLHRGIVERRTQHLAIAGLLLGFTVYCGRYTFFCNALSVGLFVLFFSRSRWRERHFWIGIAALGIVAFVVSAGRLWPMLADPAEFGRAIESRAAREKGSDLLASFYNARHPALTPLFHSVFDIAPYELSTNSKAPGPGEAGAAYLGYAPLLLAGIGLLRPSMRRRMLPWLVIVSVFLVLRLGSPLNVNGVVYEDILLPKHFLNQLLPVIAAFYSSAHFQIGVPLPLAVLACGGLSVVLPAKPRWRRIAVLLGFAAIVGFEYSFLPYAQEFQLESFEFAHWLAGQEDQDRGALAVLPMDKSGQRNTLGYMMQQTIHGYPMETGYVARRSPAAFAYIDANPLLAAWRRGHGMACGRGRKSEISAALDELQADGFGYVALHKKLAGAAPFLAAFADMTPAYDDRFTAIYALSQLRETCARGRDSLALVLDFVYGDVMPPRDEAVITFHPSERVNEDALRYMAWNADYGQRLNHITLDSRGQFSLQSTNPQMQTVDDMLSQDALLHLQAANASIDAGWMDLMTSRFKLCRRLAETDYIAVDHYLRIDMPCELVFAENPLRLEYDNGSRLRNRSHEIDADLRLHLWWQIADGAKTSYSIQLFDADGERVKQIDHVMNQSMAAHAIDLSELPPGEYSARLIAYNFETGASHGGQAAASRFERYVEIVRFTL